MRIIIDKKKEGFNFEGEAGVYSTMTLFGLTLKYQFRHQFMGFTAARFHSPVRWFYGLSFADNELGNFENSGFNVIALFNDFRQLFFGYFAII